METIWFCLIALMITAGIMGYFHIPLKASTALIFSITFGISVDNSIRFLAKYRQEMQEGAERNRCDYVLLNTGRPLAETLTLYRNNGDGTFTDVSAKVGLDRVVPAMGANFGDLDNDGYLDMYLGTGTPSLAALMPNIMLKNDGGRRFLDVTEATGTGHLQKGHALDRRDSRAGPPVVGEGPRLHAGNVEPVEPRRAVLPWWPGAQGDHGVLGRHVPELHPEPVVRGGL